MTDTPDEAPGADPSARSADYDRRADVDALLPFVYQELRILARAQLGPFRSGQTLDTTALVHEAYLKLAGEARTRFKDRKHFLTIASLAMRQILIDHARYHAARKRGGGKARLSLDQIDPSSLAVDTQAAELLALDDALDRLSRLDARLARVVELRFFGGLAVEETAEILEVSVPTVKRDTRAARAFLSKAMSEADAD